MTPPPIFLGPRSGRLVVLALAGIALLAGLVGSLVLVGALEARVLPGPAASRLAGGHGLLMVFGFLGTLIALERAVALGRPWGSIAPIAASLGGVALVAGVPAPAPALLFAVGGAGLLAIYVAFARVERSLQTTIQGLGALAWLAGSVVLLAGGGAPAAIAWLGAFLVLTIAGERLDLARLGGIGGRARLGLALVVVALLVGALVETIVPDLGARLVGIGLLGLAAWLARFDVARRTVRLGGATRFIAVSLLLGYAWLAASGLLWTTVGSVRTGLLYDALLHALFLGFVMSMVFAHAPIILPAVTALPLPYRPWFVGHLGLLHLGLLVRVGFGDLAGSIAAWQLGGILDVVAVLLFVAGSAAASIGELRRRRARFGPVGSGGTGASGSGATAASG